MQKIIHIVIENNGNTHATVSRAKPFTDVDGNIHQRTIKAYNNITNTSFLRLLKIRRSNERVNEFHLFSTLTYSYR